MTSVQLRKLHEVLEHVVNEVFRGCPGQTDKVYHLADWLDEANKLLEIAIEYLEADDD